MSTFEEINQKIRQVIDENKEVVSISTAYVADNVLQSFGCIDEPHHRWASLEMYKQMARKVMAAKFDFADDLDAPSQQDMFSGELQERYPIPRPAGDPPVYKLRHSLTVDELDWNIAKLLRASVALREHAEALQAYRDLIASEAA